MKKFFLLVLIAAVTLSPLANAAVRTTQLTTPTTPEPAATATHVVCVEEGTATWCGYCPTAAEALNALFEEEGSSHSFYFLAEVYDQSSVSKSRFLQLGGRAFPSVFLDGDFSHQVGTSGTVNQTKASYKTLIETAGAREVHAVAVNTTIVGHDNGKLDITVKITNNGNSPYFGILKSYVTEISSRWKNADGDPYHYGLLDYAFRKLVLLSPHKTKELSVTWDGAANHGNLTFPDIQDSNIMVISTLAHWMPHQIPADPTNHIGKHVAFYMDQADAAYVPTV